MKNETTLSEHKIKIDDERAIETSVVYEEVSEPIITIDYEEEIDNTVISTKEGIIKKKSIPVNIAYFADPFSLSSLLNFMSKDKFNVIVKGDYNPQTEEALNLLSNFPKAVIIGGEPEFHKSYEIMNSIKSKHYHEAQIIYLSDTTNTEHILKVMKLGVKSIIIKREHPVEKIIEDILSIIENKREYVYDDAIIKIMISSITTSKSSLETVAPPKNLTDRDKLIVKLLLQQKKLVEISDLTGTNLRTLEGIVKSIFAKFGCNNKTAFIIKALRSGFSEE